MTPQVPARRTASARTTLRGVAGGGGNPAADGHDPRRKRAAGANAAADGHNGRRKRAPAGGGNGRPKSEAGGGGNGRPKSEAGGGRRNGRRPAPLPVTGVSRRTSPGKMRKGESPKERGERTRTRIADALIDLVTESGVPPTAKEVATRAGVSVRLVFHHFEDMEALHRTVARAQFDRHWRGLRPVPPGLPIAQRIDRTVQQRAKLFDTISPVRRNAASLALRHEEIAKGFDYTNRLLRTWLEETFGHELKAAGRERRELLAAIEAAASWETWERLRRTQGFSSAAARRVVARTLRALLHA